MKTKLVTMILTAFTATAVLAGCTVTKSEMSYTYNVETGDTVKMTLNKMNGYSTTSELPFTVTKEEKDIMHGTFITMEGYDYYQDLIDELEKTDEIEIIVKDGEKDGNTYTSYKVESEAGTEYDYLLKIGDSSTGVLMGSLDSKEEASSCFEAIKFTLEK